jgi:hypothetical protein
LLIGGVFGEAERRKAETENQNLIFFFAAQPPCATWHRHSWYLLNNPGDCSGIIPGSGESEMWRSLGD